MMILLISFPVVLILDYTFPLFDNYSPEYEIFIFIFRNKLSEQQHIKQLIQPQWMSMVTFPFAWKSLHENILLAYRLEGISVINHSNEDISLMEKLKLSLPTIDTVSLSTHLISSHSLTKWFHSLEKLIRYSLAKLICKLYDQKINEQLEEFLFKQIRTNDQQQINYPLQVILLVEHLLFTQILQKYLTKQDHLAIRNLKLDFFRIERKSSNEYLDTKSMHQSAIKVKNMH